MGEHVRRGAIGAALFLAVLAVLALGLAVAFAAIYLRLAVSLPPAGATLVAAVVLCCGVALLAVLARWLRPDAASAEPAPPPARGLLVRDGFGPALAAPAIPPATAVPFGAGVMNDLHIDPADRPRRHR